MKVNLHLLYIMKKEHQQKQQEKKAGKVREVITVTVISIITIVIDAIVNTVDVKSRIITQSINGWIIEFLINETCYGQNCNAINAS